MGGSMGSAVGEKFNRACERAAERSVPLVSVTASGGARMQEGILALMQLPKTVCAVEDLYDSGGAMFSVMAHPTTAGVLASFSASATSSSRSRARCSVHRPARCTADDEGEAARRLRPRRVEPPLRPHRRDRPETRAAAIPRPTSPPVFQLPLTTQLQAPRAPLEAAQHGLLGGTSAVQRPQRLRSRSSSSGRADATASRSGTRSSSLATRTGPTRSTTSSASSTTSSNCTAIGPRRRSRARGRRRALQLADRGRARPQKGRDIKERKYRNFGMAHPEGYRKAMRVMELAERHRFPCSR